MSEPTKTTTYRLIFNGRLVAGRNAADVEAEFVRRFGEGTAQTIFSGKSVTLNRDLSRDDAQKKQRIFEQLGIVVQAVPTTPVAADLSLVESPSEPAKPQSPPDTVAPPAKPAAPAEFGVLPDRAPATKPGAKGAAVYSKAEIAEAFRDAAEIPPASRRYLVMLIPVTALMLLLPLIYMAITVSSVLGTLWFAVEGFEWFINRPGYLRLIGFLAALLGLLLLTVFLLRPLVAKVDKGAQPVRLEPAREPILFDLVDRITDAVGAPMPHEILVDADVNASARLTHGAFSKGLTLTLGMPLIYGLDLQTLTGVLAHEFGHFTQRVGMRSSSLVHTINYWFFRQVHERDNWDRFVEKWAETENVILTLAALLAQLGSFLVRLLLHLLSMLAALFSRSLSRQMEFDADRYQIGLTGSESYERTAVAMRTLGAGHQLALEDLSLAFDSDKKVDNLPRLAAMKAASFTEQQRREIMAQIEEVNRSVFDTHPSDQARIRKAIDADMPARFVHTGPAEKLLREPDRLSRLVTLQWYRSLGVEVSPDDLVPLAQFASETELLQEAESSIREYFGDLDRVPQHRPLLTPGTLAKLDDAQLLAALKDARDALYKDKLEFLRSRKKMDEDSEYQACYRNLLFWRQAGFDINLSDYPVPLATDDVSEITAMLAEYKKSETESRAALRRCVELQGKRLSLGLELAVRRGEADRKEVEALRRAYTAVAATENDVDALNECGERIDLLLQILDAMPDEAKYQRQLKSESATNKQIQSRIRRSLGSVADPFADGSPLADVLPNEYDGPEDRTHLAELDAAARMIRALARTSYKLVGRMVTIALAAE